MKIIVTGKNGQLGSTICKLDIPEFEWIAFDEHQLDITNESLIKSAIEKHQPDAIINTAAYTAVDKAEEQQQACKSVNAIGPEYLAKACKQANIPLFQISTDYVFDGNQESYTEEAPVAPINYYGLTKLQGEEAIQANISDYVILRVSAVFAIQGNNFIKAMLHHGAQRDELQVVNDQVTCPTASYDIANALVTMLKRWQQSPSDFPWGIYHFCGTPAIDWHNFATDILDYAKTIKPMQVKSIKPIPSSQWPAAAKRPQRSVLNCDKFCKTFNATIPDWHARMKKVIEANL